MQDMLEYSRKVHELIRGRTFEDYAAGEPLRMAVERGLEIVGEAAKRISADMQASHPSIPWRGITAQRDILAHGYQRLDHKLLWEVAAGRVPQLIEDLELAIEIEQRKRGEEEKR